MLFTLIIVCFFQAQVSDLKKDIDILAKETSESVMAQEILRVVDETKNDIRLVLRGDFNHLVYYKPDLNKVDNYLRRFLLNHILFQTILSHLTENQIKWFNESESLRALMATAKVIIHRCESNHRILGSACILSPKKELRYHKVFQVKQFCLFAYFIFLCR